jgi:pimeloyl-ACP methyl ester carboxylesterase
MTARASLLLALVHCLLILFWSCSATPPHKITTPHKVRVEGSLTYIRPKSAETDSLVVFVHGVFGDALATWTSPRTGAYWPDLVAKDTSLNRFAVAVAQYHTPMFSEASTIEGIAESISQDLRDRGIYREFRRVFFVTHSMGGLIMRRALSKLNQPSTVHLLDERVGVIFFISTPSSGATLAELGRWISQNPQLQDMRPINLNTFLKGLDNDWEDTLREIRDVRGKTTPRVYCAYETKSMGGFIIVPFSAMRTRCDENAKDFPRDHSEIVKPENYADDMYLWVRARLLGINKIVGSVTWEGSETIGELVDRLVSWHRKNITSELIRYRSESDKKALEKVWISKDTYIAQSWGELFEILSKHYPCISVSIRHGIEIELSARTSVKSCPESAGDIFYTCQERPCER